MAHDARQHYKYKISNYKREAKQKRKQMRRKKHTKRTEEQKRMFLECYADKKVVYAACEHAGITRAKYAEWKYEDAAFAEACNAVLESQVDLVERAVFKKAIKGDVSAGMFILNAKRGYREDRQTETDAFPKNININIVTKSDDKESE